MKRLVVVCLDLEECLGMAAHGTYLGGLVAILQVAAVAAVPHLHGGLLEDLVVLQVLHQLQVPLVVGLLNLAHAGEHVSDAVEALFPGLLRKGGVHSCCRFNRWTIC